MELSVSIEFDYSIHDRFAIAAVSVILGRALANKNGAMFRFFKDRVRRESSLYACHLRVCPHRHTTTSPFAYHLVGGILTFTVVNVADDDLQFVRPPLNDTRPELLSRIAIPECSSVCVVADCSVVC